MAYSLLKIKLLTVFDNVNVISNSKIKIRKEQSKVVMCFHRYYLRKEKWKTKNEKVHPSIQIIEQLRRWF